MDCPIFKDSVAAIAFAPHLGHRLSRGWWPFSCRETEPRGAGRQATPKSQNAAGAMLRAKLCRTEGGVNAFLSTNNANRTRSAQNVRLYRSEPTQPLTQRLRVPDAITLKDVGRIAEVVVDFA